MAVHVQWAAARRLWRMHGYGRHQHAPQNAPGRDELRNSDLGRASNRAPQGLYQHPRGACCAGQGSESGVGQARCRVVGNTLLLGRGHAVLLAGLFGLPVAALYVATGLLVAIVGRTHIGHLGLEDQVEEYVRHIKVGSAVEQRPSFDQRVRDALVYTRDLLKRVFRWVLAGIAIGAIIHGYAPTDFTVEHAGRDNPFAVPLAVLI